VQALEVDLRDRRAIDRVAWAIPRLAGEIDLSVDVRIDQRGVAERERAAEQERRRRQRGDPLGVPGREPLPESLHLG
jgi:hypothetical protein